jgi:hypothetical protein
MRIEATGFETNTTGAPPPVRAQDRLPLGSAPPIDRAIAIAAHQQRRIFPLSSGRRDAGERLTLKPELVPEPPRHAASHHDLWTSRHTQAAQFDARCRKSNQGD